MYDDVRHRGAWLPADARLDEDASDRMVAWIKGNVPNLGKRVIITQQLANSVDGPPAALAALAKGAPRKNERGDGPDWQWCSGPVVAAWPDENMLYKCIPMATDQTLIVFEWSRPRFFEGWATATEAFNAATGETMEPLPQGLHKEFIRVYDYDRELVESAIRGRDRQFPQRHLRNLHDAGLDEDFVVTYGLALNQGIEPRYVRAHYRAATGQPPAGTGRRR